MYQTFKLKDNFKLESGEYLQSPEIAFNTYGNPDSDKVVWICHAFTANSDPMEWWPGLVGKDKCYDPVEYFIVCANILGSCYGTTGPLSVNPETSESYYRTFPTITVRDIVRAHDILREHLNIKKIHTLIGGSVGGHQVLEWSILQPDLLEHIIVIASNAKFSPWGIAFSESQRMAIEADPTFADDKPDGGSQGMKTARSIALLSYRNWMAYNQTQSDMDNKKLKDFKVCSYQRYQGEKLARRFNAYSYHKLSYVLDSHNVGRKRKSIEWALGQIAANTLLISISSDILFLKEEQELMYENIKSCEWQVIESDFGHDGFLLEFEKITEIIKKFYQK